MDWNALKDFLLKPAGFIIIGTPEEINALRKGKQLEKEGLTELLEFKEE